VWMIIDRLELVDQACNIALEVGFTACGVNAGNLFRALILLGLLWVVVQTAVLVFLAFLYNLIADLTGGLTFGIVDDTPAGPARATGPRTATTGAAGAAGATAKTARRPTERRTNEFDRPVAPREPHGSRAHRQPAEERAPDRGVDTAARPPVPPIAAEVDGAGVRTDGFAVDDQATSRRKPDQAGRDDDLFGPR